MLRSVLKKAKFAVAFPAHVKALARLPKPSKCTVENGIVKPEIIPEINAGTEGYYLDDGNPGGTPLYGKFFPAATVSAGEIARAIRNYALRTNLETLANKASTLPSQISLTVNKISGAEIVEKCRDGIIERGLKSRPNAADIQIVKDGRIPVGSVFSFKAKNISGDIRREKDQYAAGEPLYIAAVYLLNNGDIDVIYPRLGAKDPLADGVEKSFGGYIASKPKGAEQLILIISKSFVDFSFYESVGTSRNSKSTLEKLLNQGGTKTRDSGTLIPDEPDSWGVLRVDLDIVD